MAGLTPWALAIVRQLQCVWPGGLLCVVACTIASILAAEIDGLRPRPGRVSVSACGPPSANRARHRITVGRDTPSRRAILLLATPAPASNTIRARSATPCGVVGALTQRSSSARCSSETTVAGVPAMLGTLHQHRIAVKLF